MDSSDSSKKQLLENLSKEELVIKYRGLLQILQKAKQTKASLIEENNNLKGKLVTGACDEELKRERDVVQNKLQDCEINLSKAQSRIAELVLENQTYAQNLKQDNLQQHDQFEIEQNLKTERDELERSNLELLAKNEESTKNYDDLLKSYKTLQINYVNSEVLVTELSKQNEIHVNTSDDLNTELHKNRTLVEKLQQDIVNLSRKLSDSQIISSGVASDLENANEKLKDKLKLFHSKIVKFAGDVKMLKQEKVCLLENFKGYIHQVRLWEAQLKEFSEVVLNRTKQLEDESAQLKLQIATMRNENYDLQIRNDQLTENVATLKLNNNHLHELKLNNKQLTDEINKSTKQIEELNVKLVTVQEENQLLQRLKNDLEIVENDKTHQESELRNLKLEIEESESKIVRLTQENNTLTNLKSSLETQISTSKDEIFNLKKDNSELLKEMNEMNQVLKERGETISKQQEYLQELLRDVKVFELQAKERLETIVEKEKIISKLECDIDDISLLSKKDEEISQLHNELTVLREKLLDSSQEMHYAESENMSTSTISKTEEMSRLKDLEGSWEERYGKLRSLALKLKGKIRELTKELTKEQNEKADVLQKLTNTLQTVQSLQAQCDRVQDQLEESRGEIKDYSKKLDLAALDISNNKKQLAKNDELITDLRAEIEGFIKEKANTDNWKKQVSFKVQNLKKELESKNSLKLEFENQIAKLNSDLEVKETLLKEEMDKHNTTKNSLQESNNECKKQSVLNLEMQDYERTLKDLTQKLDKKQELINKLKAQVDLQKNAVSATKEQNRQLEERIHNEESDLQSARNEIQAYKKGINDLEIKLIQKDDKIHDLTQVLEDSRGKNEDLSTQLSKIVAENEKMMVTLKSEKDYLRSQNLGLEQKLSETEDTLKLNAEELKEIRKEYQGYKVRAQSVLRQNQIRDVGLEEKLSEEAASFKAQVMILTSETEELRKALENLKDEHSKLKVTKKQIEDQFRNVENDLTEAQEQHELLSVKHQNSLLEHAEAIRALKVHAETLAQCYRQQLSEQEVRHNREIIELQSKIDKIIPVLEMPPAVTAMIPREQGEGSENIESANMRNLRPVPLDKLLSEDVDLDVGFLKKQAVENDAKVIHLTALLADTEQDLAKHVQMNKLLKEEIRRQQRSVEREQHAENLEYLKNVVFKFATLHNGNERSRLVPVLNTILKFSPEEIHKLNMIAKGDDGLRGWSNYLPVWPSSSRPH